MKLLLGLWDYLFNYLFLIGVAAAGVFAGIALRKRKNLKK